MYIRTRTRGTNQHQEKAELKDVSICRYCRHLFSTVVLDSSGPFVTKKRNDKCSNCGREQKEKEV